MVSAEVFWQFMGADCVTCECAIKVNGGDAQLMWEAAVGVLVYRVL